MLREIMLHIVEYSALLPGDLDTNAGEQANQVLSTTYKWTEKFYDIGKEKEREIIRRN